MFHGVIDGARTRDIRLHKPALYQLSYDHHERRRAAMNTTPESYYSRLANSSATAAEMTCTSSVVGPGSATNAALR